MSNETNTNEKMNILQVLVKLRNNIKDWVTAELNKVYTNINNKLDKRFTNSAEQFVVTNSDSDIVSINKEEMLERLGIEIVSENNIPTEIEEGKIYFVYEE